MEQEARFGTGSGFPFSTTDAFLANCLYAAGIKPCPWSPRNIYTEDILFTAGGGKKDGSGNIIKKSRFSGMKIWDACQKAWQEMVRGKIEYHFEHSPEIVHFCEAYADQIKKLNEGDGDAGEAIREIMRLAAGRLKEGETVMDEREALLRILAVSLTLRKEFVNAWKNGIPVLLIPNKGKVTEQDTQTVIDGKVRQVHRIGIPGGKFIPLNASKETLKEMELA